MAQVDSISGRFVVGPIGAFDTIVIPLQGYREFRSHNAFIGRLASTIDSTAKVALTLMFFPRASKPPHLRSR